MLTLRGGGEASRWRWNYQLHQYLGWVQYQVYALAVARLARDHATPSLRGLLRCRVNALVAAGTATPCQDHSSFSLPTLSLPRVQVHPRPMGLVASPLRLMEVVADASSRGRGGWGALADASGRGMGLIEWEEGDDISLDLSLPLLDDDDSIRGVAEWDDGSDDGSLNV